MAFVHRVDKRLLSSILRGFWLSVEGVGYRRFFLLLSGDLKQGWKEYEWRWKAKEYLKYSCFHRPDDFFQTVLNRLDIEGQTVLIYAEQGLGL